MLHFPVLRQAFIVSSGEPLGRPVAERIAQAVLDQSDAIVRSIGRTLVSDEGIVVDPSAIEAAANGQSDVRDEGTIVIDFPSVMTKIDGKGAAVRSCVAPCGLRGTKIWTRINYIPSNLDGDDADAVLLRYEHIATRINDALTATYATIVRQELDVDVDKTYEIVIRSATQDEKAIDDYFFDVFRDGATPDAAAVRLVADSIRSVDHGFVTVPSRDAPDQIDDRKRQQIGFSSLRPTLGESDVPLHQIRAVYVIDYDADRARMAGIGFDPYLKDATALTSVSHVTSANMAMEYGELF